jgi:putative ABC transport system permease protein
MNPFPLVRVLLKRSQWLSVAFVLLAAVAVAVGLAITVQERALRKSSARAAEPFDLIVAAPGSQADVLLSSVFLRTGSLELLPPQVTAEVMAHPATSFVAPMGFGDNWQGHPVVGTTADLVQRIARRQPVQGRLFAAHEEAVVGSAVPLAIGQTFAAEHGHGDDEHEAGGVHGTEFRIVGKLPSTGTPWDKSVIIPIETMWEQHGLPNGHPEGSEQIGPPFDSARLPGVPLLVVEPKTLADAYGLRSTFRTSASTAFFPAETLVSLFPYLADIRTLMSVMATGTQALVFGCVMLALIILFGTQRQLFATLRALGAPRRYVLVTVWLAAALVVVTGCLLGFAAGQALSFVISRSLAAGTGLELSPWFGWPEILNTLLLILLSTSLAMIPAVTLYRVPASDVLRK